MFLSPRYVLMVMLVKTPTSLSKPTSFHVFFHRGTGQGWRTIHLYSSEGWYPNSGPRLATDSSHGLDSWCEPDFPICEPSTCCALRAGFWAGWGMSQHLPSHQWAEFCCSFKRSCREFWDNSFQVTFLSARQGKGKQRLTMCRRGKICMMWFNVSWWVSLISIINRLCEFHMMYYLSIVDAFLFH